MAFALATALALTFLSAAGPVLSDGPAAPGVAAHPGPPVYVEVEIGERGVVFRFTGEQNTLYHWLGLPVPEGATVARPSAELESLPPLGPDDVTRIRAALAEFFGRRNGITIDGEERGFEIDDVAIPSDFVTGYGLPALTFALRYDLDDAPRRIDVVWEVWDRLSWFDQTKLPLLFRSFGEAQLAFLTPEEPGHTWHASSVVPRRPPDVAEVAAPPPEELTIPLVSAAVVLVLLVASPLLWRAGVGLALVGVLWLSGFAAAAMTWDLARLPVPNPFLAEVGVPTDERDAAALFERLHRNIYAAFDARSEEEIYDLLATSVSPDLLDELYGEIYESLIMRGAGGAVCKVETVEIVDREVDLQAGIEPWEVVPDGTEAGPFFKVDWTWRVHGVVSHWGHEHRRTNNYEARYIVGHDGRSWKIASVEILDHSRIDRDG